MKKIIYFLSAALILTGCSMTSDMSNTPTKKVEAFLNNYQTADTDVLDDLDNTINSSTNFTDEDKTRYRELMKKHYQDLTYEIKNEKIDGDKATVTVEITVNDYSKVLSDADVYKTENEAEFNDETGAYDESLFTKYRLDQLEKATDKKTYTLEIPLTKENNEWILDDLSTTDQDKINGTYIEQ